MRFKGERRILHVLSAYSTNQVLKIKKKHWIEKLQSVLSIVKPTWKGKIITGDSNIDLLASTEI